MSLGSHGGRKGALVLALAVAGCTDFKKGDPSDLFDPDDAAEGDRESPRASQAGGSAQSKTSKTSATQGAESTPDEAKSTEEDGAAPPPDEDNTQDTEPTPSQGDAGVASTARTKAAQKGGGADQEHALDLGVVEEAPTVVSDDLVGTQMPRTVYRFRIEDNGTLTYGITKLQSNAYVTVSLLLSATIVKLDVAYDSVAANGEAKLTEIVLERGEYYIVVKPAGNVAALFDLSLSFKPYAYPEPDSGDPGEDKQGACDLGPLTSLRTIGGYVGGTDASDFYRFELESNAPFQLGFTNIVGLFNVELYSDAQILNDASILKNWAGVRADLYPADALAAGVYYLKVSRYGTNYQGLYQLQITRE